MGPISDAVKQTFDADTYSAGDPIEYQLQGKEVDELRRRRPRHDEIPFDAADKMMATQHEAWAKTLAPLGEIPKIRAGQPIIPSGHGWALAEDGK